MTGLEETVGNRTFSASEVDSQRMALDKGLLMLAQRLGLYIQVPFCASKCSFCNFSSRVLPAALLDNYLKAMEAELRLLPRNLCGHNIPEAILRLKADSVYVGGGTPSLLGSQRLQALAELLTRTFDVARAAEFTVEVTPGSADDRLLEEMAACGVNRLSIGAQSFDDRELGAVGRLHSAADTVDQVRRARCAGIRQINLDLIAGLPHQSDLSWKRSLDCVLEIAPEHISVYLFEADEKSRLGREVTEGGKRYHAESIPGEEFTVSAYEEARRRLCNSGYRQYEISNFAAPGFESNHNLKYWRLDPYLGLGAGAHSFDGRCRWANVEPVEEYERRLFLGNSPISEIRTLAEAEQMEEFFFLGLRQREGVDLDEACARWGRRCLEPWHARIDDLARGGWLEVTDTRVRLSERALLVSNEIFQEFVAA